MAIKTTEQFLDCAQILGIFPDDYQPSGTNPYSNGTLSMRFLVTKMIDTDADLGGYMFVPQLFQTKNTSSAGGEVEITINTIKSTTISLGKLGEKSIAEVNNINKVLIPQNWQEITPQLNFGLQVPQRGESFAFRGNVTLVYAITGETDDRELTFEFSSVLYTETLEKNIFNPIGAQPYNSPIDATDEEIDFNMVFKGAKAQTGAVEIFDSFSDERVYPAPLKDLAVESFAPAIYNDDQVQLVAPSGDYTDHNLINGEEYYWRAILSQYSDSADVNNMVDKSQTLFYKDFSNLAGYEKIWGLYRATPASTAPTISYTPKDNTTIRVMFIGDSNGENTIGHYQYNGSPIPENLVSYRFFTYQGSFYIDMGSEFNGDRAIASGVFNPSAYYDITFGNKFVLFNPSNFYFINATPTANLTNKVSSITELEIGAGFSGVFFDVHIHEGNSFIKHYTPMKRISDSHVGLYDLLSGEFIDFHNFGYIEYTNPESEEAPPAFTTSLGSFTQLNNSPIEYNADNATYSSLYPQGIQIQGVNLPIDENGITINFKFSANFISGVTSSVQALYPLNIGGLCFLGCGTLEGSSIKISIGGTTIPTSFINNPINYFEGYVNLSYSSAEQIIIGSIFVSQRNSESGDEIASGSTDFFITNITSLQTINYINLFDANYSSYPTIQNYWNKKIYSISCCASGIYTNQIYPFKDNIGETYGLFDITQQCFYSLKNTDTPLDTPLIKTTKYNQYPKFRTPDYSFYAYDEPEVIFNFDNATIQGNLVRISSNVLSFSGTYSQAQGVGIKTYSVFLRDNNNNLITSKENIYSENINFEFTGLLASATYSLNITVLTQAGQTYSQSFTVNSNFGTQTVTAQQINFKNYQITNRGIVLFTVNSKPLDNYSTNKILIGRRTIDKNYYEEYYSFSPNSSQISGFVDLGLKNSVKYIYSVSYELENSLGVVSYSTPIEFEFFSSFECFNLFSLQRNSGKYLFNFNASFDAYDGIYYEAILQGETLILDVGIGNINPKDWITLIDTNNNSALFEISSVVFNSQQGKYYCDVKFITGNTNIGEGEDNSIASVGVFDLDRSNLWSFTLNCQEGEITQNQNKTPISAFAHYPQFYIGDNNYNSGSFSALLNVNYVNDTYQDTIATVKRWENFIRDNKICLYKNFKGDIMIVVVDANSRRKYMNEIANYNVINSTEISAYPTTVEFNFTEVDSIDKLEGIICP